MKCMRLSEGRERHRVGCCRRRRKQRAELVLAELALIHPGHATPLHIAVLSHQPAS